MVTVWPDDRASQIQTVRQLYSDVQTLERQYVPATIIDTSDPTETELNAAWDSVYDGSPQFNSKVSQLDSSEQRVIHDHVATPYFNKVIPSMQRNWELLDSFRQEYGGSPSDFDAIALPQTYEKIVVLAKLHSLDAGVSPNFEIQINGLSDAGYHFTTLAVFANRNPPTTGYANSYPGVQTSFDLSWVGGVDSDPPSSTRVWLEFPFYTNPDTYVELFGKYTVNMADKDNVPTTDYYLFNSLVHIYGAYFTTAVALTQLTFLAGTGFAPGTNIQIYGVNPL